MDTIVLKFGGSSVASYERLKMAAQKITELYDQNNKIVVIVSAQGNMTDKLLDESHEISKDPSDRELDVLLSAGEQISMAKMSMLLNEMGYPAISLTGWQSGIFTNNTNQNAIIENIDTTRINKELDEGRIVVISGFQGYNENLDITTLGRGGSDTSAIAVAAALNAKNCYIYSDVEGVYSADPNLIKSAKKIPTLSYDEMLELSNEGAQVLHNRSIEIGDKFNIPIITKSTFNKESGSVVSNVIEDNTVKSIVKKDISRISIVGNGIIRNTKALKAIIEEIEKNKLEIIALNVTETKVAIDFKNTVENEVLEKFHDILIQ